MKAQVLHAIGDIRYEEVPEPELRPGEVLLAVKAAGICGSDVPRVFETGAHKMPLIPGHEFSGMVERAYEDSDTKWQGKRVGIFPLIPCRKCGPCRQGHFELCRHYDYVGSRRDGAFAELVAVPAANLVELPDEVSFEEAAMLEPMAVAVHAMRRGFGACHRDARTADALQHMLEADADQLKNLRVAVIGAGTIGLLLSMFLLDAGVQHLYLIGNKESQRERATCLKAGASDAALRNTEANRSFSVTRQGEIYFCNSREADAAAWLREQTDGGADLVFECVGKADTYALAIECAAPMGAVVQMGNPYGDMLLSRNTYWKILRDQLTLTGTWNSSFDIAVASGDGSDPSVVPGLATPDDWHYVLDRLAAGSIRPAQFITHRLSLSDLERGLRIMRDKTGDYCKIMICS